MAVQGARHIRGVLDEESDVMLDMELIGTHPETLKSEIRILRTMLKNTREALEACAKYLEQMESQRTGR